MGFATLTSLGTLSSVVGHIVQHCSFLAEGTALLCWLVILSISLTKVFFNNTRFKTSSLLVLHA